LRIGLPVDFVRLGLVYDGHVAIPLKLLQVPPNQVAHLIDGAVGFFDLLLEALKDLFGLVAEKLHQDVALVLEIKVNGSIGDAGFPGDLGNGGLMKPVAGENLYGGFQNAVILVVFTPAVNRGPPAKMAMNEYSFI
jgi:hypothetical protein